MRTRGKRGGVRRGPQYGLLSRCGEHILRGSVGKLVELYEELARSAMTQIEAENFRQHAEHYRRVISDGSMC